MATIGQLIGRDSSAKPEEMQGVVIKVNPGGTAIAQMKDGGTVLLPAWGKVKTAQIGDTFSFHLEAIKGSRSLVTYFGGSPNLVERAIASQDWPTEETQGAGLSVNFESKIKGLPDHHEKHFQRGQIVFGPRPCDLDAQRRTLRQIQTAQTS